MTNPEMKRKEDLIFKLERQLLRLGYKQADIESVVLSIAGISQTKHVRCTSQQTADKVISIFVQMKERAQV